ncbi:hypothetical protein Esi_0018_0095 [Ectocarpus siliculosus]|uniref:Uncharacterized protein n=1 Tax=Ectocarpus siliculosus TaxID=2880 RepID=D7FNK4_ECTSI|nr:hypothetical protein Esi_0018_0095 [Ectocarpus siliculosus]|eukprot:CBJ26015.1 hypothetical protein Esi_0018_0095 [Ectocarpus siliculosus]
MKRVGQLKSTLAKAPDPPAVAAELALLYLVLSDQRGALKSFQLAAKPSPERVPTKEETDKREMQERRLMLLNKDRRAEALAQLEAQDAEREREREATEHARRRKAATGVYRCLLEMKQPVQAAEAARARLDMCETREERQQVETEIHETLLKYDGLIEPEATNQGAWLTESAGALSDLHADVLRSLTGFSMHEKSASPSSCWGTSSSGGAMEAVDDPEEGSCAPGMEINHRGGGVETTGRAVGVSADGYRGNNLLEGGDSTLTKEGAFSATVCEGAGSSRGYTCGGNGPRDVAATTAEVAPDRMNNAEEERDVRRSRLQDLGHLLVRKRQFTASRQAFDDARRGGPDEASLRERNKGRTPGFFIDGALEEASPKIRLELDSRWQGGVETDDIRRRALANFTGFTGLHRGAETLVAVVPAAGWADGGNAIASEIAYAERLSRSRIQVDSLQQHVRTGGGATRGIGGAGACVAAGRAGGAGAKQPTAAASGLMLRHLVPAKDVIANIQM